MILYLTIEVRINDITSNYRGSYVNDIVLQVIIEVRTLMYCITSNYRSYVNVFYCNYRGSYVNDIVLQVIIEVRTLMVLYYKLL